MARITLTATTPLPELLAIYQGQSALIQRGLQRDPNREDAVKKLLRQHIVDLGQLLVGLNLGDECDPPWVPCGSDCCLDTDFSPQRVNTTPAN